MTESDLLGVVAESLYVTHRGVNEADSVRLRAAVEVLEEVFKTRRFPEDGIGKHVRAIVELAVWIGDRELSRRNKG